MKLRTHLPTFAVVAAVSIAAPVSAQSDRCDERRTVEREISADGIRLLDVEARQGSLDIRGRSGTGQILVTAELCAENPADLALNLTNVILTRLAQLPNLELVARQDLANLLDQEQQRQLLGCGEDVSLEVHDAHVFVHTGWGEWRIGYGAGADAKVLSEIADETRAKFFVGSPETIREVL